MKKILLIIYLAVACSADELVNHSNESFAKAKNDDVLPQKIKEYTAALKVVHDIESIENIVSEAKGFVTEDESYDINELANKLEDLTELVKARQNADTFLNTQGINRVITNLIGVNNEVLKIQLLALMKTLFNVTSTTTEVIPSTIIDKILDIFEHENNVVLKSYAIDIMSVWLPNNPKIQTRVMKLKGLEPFYDQISKLGSNDVRTLLELFNKILKEHVAVRDKNYKDFEHKKLYEKIGLIEGMTTPTVCNGILNIFDVILPIEDKKQLPIIFDLIKNIKPYCLKFYKRKNQAKSVFEELERHFKDSDMMGFLADLGINLIEVELTLNDYIKMIHSNIKDEF